MLTVIGAGVYAFCADHACAFSLSFRFSCCYALVHDAYHLRHRRADVDSTFYVSDFPPLLQVIYRDGFGLENVNVAHPFFGLVLGCYREFGRPLEKTWLVTDVSKAADSKLAHFSE